MRTILAETRNGTPLKCCYAEYHFCQVFIMMSVVAPSMMPDRVSL